MRRLTAGKWSNAAGFDWPREIGRTQWSGIGLGLRAVRDAGPPWILHDRRNELLLHLWYGPSFKGTWLDVFPLSDDGKRLHVRDAVSSTKVEVLLATDRGLRTFAIDGGRITVPPLIAGGRPVSHLAQDGHGRLWLGGEGLAVLDADGKALHPLDALPVPGRSKTDALAADPGHAEGAVEGRGVVFMRVEAR